MEGIAQVDLEAHRNRHQPLQELTPMAYAVLAAVARRLEREGRLTGWTPRHSPHPVAWSASPRPSARRWQLSESSEPHGAGAG